jgi:hypothetical protein
MDLNRDELIRVDLRANYSELKRLWLPKTAVEADSLVSMAQGENPSLVRRHSQHEEHVWHRPGNKYGWPKPFSTGTASSRAFSTSAPLGEMCLPIWSLFLS